MSIFVEVANNRYIDKPYRFNKRNPSISELEVGLVLFFDIKKERQRLQKTHRYQYYPLTLDTVRIIDDLNRSVKGIRFELSRTLKMKVLNGVRIYLKRVPQIHFIHLVR